jgi:pimeloyl-ACP methyl ester carboxylesterase
MIDFYGGAGTFAAWPSRVRDYAVRTTPVNLRDWASGYGFPLPPRLLHRLDLPVQVVCGADSHPAVKRANQLLDLHLPLAASLVAVPDAAHFMIATHAQSVAGIVRRFVTRVERRSVGARVPAGLL